MTLHANFFLTEYTQVIKTQHKSKKQTRQKRVIQISAQTKEAIQCYHNKASRKRSGTIQYQIIITSDTSLEVPGAQSVALAGIVNTLMPS